MYLSPVKSDADAEPEMETEMECDDESERTLNDDVFENDKAVDFGRLLKPIPNFLLAHNTATAAIAATMSWYSPGLIAGFWSNRLCGAQEKSWDELLSRTSHVCTTLHVLLNIA